MPARHGADSAIAVIRAQAAGAAELERLRGTALHLLPVGLALGAIFYFSVPFEPDGRIIAAMAGLLAAAVLAAPAGGWARALMAALLAIACGAGAAKFESWRASTPMLGAEITTRLTGRVVEIERQADGRVRLTLDVLATQRPALRYAPDRLRASARQVPADLAIGDVVNGVVRLFPASGPVRPQGYDFAFRNYFLGLGAGGFFLTGPDHVPVADAARFGEPSRIDGLRRDLENWRLSIASRISQRIGGADGAIAAALITGIRAGIPESVNEALRITGLYHIISISGLHMALVGGTVMLSLRTLFALAPGFSMRRPVKKYAAAGALAASAFYLLISGGDVAAQRSFLMLAVMLVAILFDRAALTMRNLAISAIVILLAAPHEVMGPSFQMSFAATAALIATYAAWSARAKRRTDGPRARPAPRNLLATGLRYTGALALTSIVAGGATALFTAWHFQQVSPLGLVANLAVMPVVSIVVMPMALVACLLMPFGLDGPALDFMGWGIGAMVVIAERLAERSAFDATGTIPLGALILVTAALAALTLLASRARLVAIPLAIAGAVMLAAHKQPDILISEDARLVAVRTFDGAMAVNRTRPNAFTLNNWKRAIATREVLKPIRIADAGEFARPDRIGQAAVPAGPSAQPAFASITSARAAQMPAPSEQPAERIGEFSCDPAACVAHLANGAMVVHLAEGGDPERFCATAQLIVIDDATAPESCATGKALVLTKRTLARRGSVELRLGSGTGPLSAHDLRFAVAEPYRPWHAYRQYSRPARGLAPYRRE